jgi:eukaryotic-like serine/threonine-protein kinase
MAAQAHDRLGLILGGKYRLDRIIGEGATASVYEATDVVSQHRFAIKVIKAAVLERSKTIAARFLREARVSSTVSHAAIVETIDAGRESDGSLYLVQELLEGENMSEAIARGDLAPKTIASIGVEVLEALAVIHEQGVIHRDLKPENIFLMKSPDGSVRPKILDFGLAKSLNELVELTRTGVLLGTPIYMSPEQAGGERDPDARTDLWSFGATLFHAFAGRPPFASFDLMTLLAELSTSRPPSLAALKPTLPASLVAVIDRALEPDVDARWSSARHMRDALAGTMPELDPLPEQQVFEERTAPNVLLPGSAHSTEMEGQDAFVPQKGLEPTHPAHEPGALPRSWRVPWLGITIVTGLVALTLAWISRPAPPPRPTAFLAPEVAAPPASSAIPEAPIASPPAHVGAPSTPITSSSAAVDLEPVRVDPSPEELSRPAAPSEPRAPRAAVRRADMRIKPKPQPPKRRLTKKLPAPATGGEASEPVAPVRALPAAKPAVEEEKKKPDGWDDPLRSYE